MTQRHPITTNQFSTVIDALQLGKKTGILTVERGEGETFEEGTITFVNGQVVNASLNPYQGRDAAIKLFSWQACRFSFVAMLPEQIHYRQEAPPLSTGPAEAASADRHLQYELRQAKPGGRDDLSRRPFPITYTAESLEAILFELDRQGFTRVHRRLFLLIDGKRSIEELALLVRHTPDEMMVLLADLERAGFIRLADFH